MSAIETLPRLVILLALPHHFFSLELLDAQRLRLRVALRAGGVRVLVEPDVLRGLTLREEEQVRLDARVRREHALRQPHDRVEVALLEQLLLDARLDALAEERPVGKTSAARPPGFSSVMISTRNRSAVSRVRKVAGKLFSMPSSSIPPNGGFVTITSTRSFGP
jgi:hypothetical protein